MPATPERIPSVENQIRTQVAKVLGFSDVKLIDTEEKFADLGMDSLMAVEFKNNLQVSFGDVISLTTAFDYPSVPYNGSRLRFFITCLHTEEQIDFTMDTVVKAMGEI